MAYRLQRTLKSLAKKKNGKIHGWQMFFRDRVRKVKPHAGDNGIARRRRCQDVMRTNSNEYAALPEREKARWIKKSLEHEKARKQALKRAQEHFQVRLRDLLREEEEREASKSLPNHVCQSRLTDAEMEKACQYFNDANVQSLRAQKHIGGFHDAPAEPKISEMDTIMNAVNRLERDLIPTTPWWCRDIARLRDAFACAGVGEEIIVNVL